MIRIYVFPTLDRVPRIGAVKKLAHERLAALLTQHGIDREPELDMMLESQFDEDVCLRDDTDDTVPLYEAESDEDVYVDFGASPGSVRLRGTFIRDNPLEGRERADLFARQAAEAAMLGRGWAVEADDTADVMALFSLGAIAGALAELTGGLVVSWQAGLLRDRTPCLPEAMYRWWADPAKDAPGLLNWAVVVADLRLGRDLEPHAPYLEHEVPIHFNIESRLVVDMIRELVDDPDLLADEIIRLVRSAIAAGERMARAS